MKIPIPCSNNCGRVRFLSKREIENGDRKLCRSCNAKQNSKIRTGSYKVCRYCDNEYYSHNPDSEHCSNKTCEAKHKEAERLTMTQKNKLLNKAFKPCI